MQERIKKFDEERLWNSFYAKDILLNITEEVGEAWNIIKWVQEPKEQQKLINKHRDEFENFIGDALFLILKLANQVDINARISLEKTLKEYEKRFPAEKTRGKHANVLAGGIDERNNI